MMDLFPNRELIQKYRNLFSSGEGIDVLTHMLYELGFHKDMPIMTQEEIILRNYATRILQIIGGGSISVNSLKYFVNALSNQKI